MKNQLFKIVFFIGIVIFLIIHIALLFDLFRMSETDMISWSYLWIAAIAYGLTGWVTPSHMRIKEGTSIHLIPLLAAGGCIVTLGFFLMSIFPML